MMRGALLLLALVACGLQRAAQAELMSNTTVPETQCTGSEEEGSFCFVAASTFPSRECACVRNTCPSGSISETINCFICDRGGCCRPP